MKPFKLKINWDRLRDGEFPAKELISRNPETKITYNKLSTFKSEVTIEINIPDEEEPLEVAYVLGRLIDTIIIGRIL